MRWLLALVLVAPVASAGVPFEIVIDDDLYDVKGIDRRPLNYSTVDIVQLRSSVINGTVRQEVEMRERPKAPDDSILLRSWFHDSENGSFHVIDMEVRGNEPQVEKRFKPLMRRGDFHNATHVDHARWGVVNTTWVFEFPASYVDDATCFDLGAFSETSPPARMRLPQGFDDAYLRDVRRCVTALEPESPVPRAPIVGVPPQPESPAPPGSITPTPFPGSAAIVGLGALALLLRRR